MQTILLGRWLLMDNKSFSITESGIMYNNSLLPAVQKVGETKYGDLIIKDPNDPEKVIVLPTNQVKSAFGNIIEDGKNVLFQGYERAHDEKIDVQAVMNSKDRKVLSSARKQIDYYNPVLYDFVYRILQKVEDGEPVDEQEVEDAISKLDFLPNSSKDTSVVFTQKLYKKIIYVYVIMERITKNFPRHSYELKHSLKEDTLDILNKVVMLIWERETNKRLSILLDMNMDIQKIRSKLYISAECKYISFKKIRYVQYKYDELGKMIGFLLKKVRHDKIENTSSDINNNTEAGKERLKYETSIHDSVENFKKSLEDSKKVDDRIIEKANAEKKKETKNNHNPSDHRKKKTGFFTMRKYPNPI